MSGRNLWTRWSATMMSYSLKSAEVFLELDDIRLSFVRV